ncbi:hypothetical protein [Maribacter sp.]|uniref:hypothetical protein n=1 Tax=Maribacter sp. TaxID=1897614 RepID=UPI0025BF7EC8|nr:hypothetical protein [Maribacter sp.]
MEQNKYLEDISEIKNMMSRSSRFISLSGISGILAGIYALIGAYLAHSILVKNPLYMFSSKTDVTRYSMLNLNNLYFIAIGVIIAAAITGVLLTLKKSRESGEKMWDVTSKRLVFNFLIPLFTGGLFCLSLIQNEIYGLVAPATLLFYGLACVNASKYTLRDVRYLGFANIIIGLIATQFIGYGLYFWALGFGVFHILYGSIMYFKYDKKN